jgi:hypothetical protein
MLSFKRSAVVMIQTQSRYTDVWSMGGVLDGVRNATTVQQQYRR